MKTIKIIDGAENCAYDCFLAEEELFAALFPDEGQNIEFFEDFADRDPNGEFDIFFQNMWKRRIAKKDVQGIDGTLFYELIHKKTYYPTKRESDLDGFGRSQAE